MSTVVLALPSFILLPLAANFVPDAQPDYGLHAGLGGGVVLIQRSTSRAVEFQQGRRPPPPRLGWQDSPNHGQHALQLYRT